MTRAPSLRVVVALDSFKGSLDSRAAGAAARSGIVAALDLEGVRDVEVLVREVADGGEGTVSAILSARGGREVVTPTVDALGRPLEAAYGEVVTAGGRLAVLEAARTLGLGLVGGVDASLPPRASSYGLGMQLRAAVASGADRVLVGLGGTATTDGGCGLLAALGAEVVTDDGRPARPDGNALWTGATLRPGGLPRLPVPVHVLTDVRSPLIGPEGAARTFGPQKGATPEQVAHLEAAMQRWAASLPDGVADLPGAGAAGGLGAALAAVGGILEPGFERVADETGLADALAGADLVLTGEGTLDQQSGWGKTPAGVARLARDAGAVVVGLAGRVDRPVAAGLFDAVLAVHSRPRSLAEAMDPAVAATEVAATAGEVARLVRAVRCRRPRA